jgi:hypothetical protein
MLEEAGIRTVFAEAWEALMRGADALEAFTRARYGELDPDDISAIEELDRMVRPTRRARALVAA